METRVDVAEDFRRQTSAVAKSRCSEVGTETLLRWNNIVPDHKQFILTCFSLEHSCSKKKISVWV